MNWPDVGGWIKDNAGSGAALVGSLLTGNIPGAIASGISLVSSATGSTDPAKALEALQTSPETILKLKELALREEENIRENLRLIEESRLKNEQSAHEQQQLTIRYGDSSEDNYVRHTRPMMARQSWYATIFYIIFFEALKASSIFSAGASFDLAMILLAPAGAYLGFRSLDKFWKK